jgi:hypothetical protein
MEMLWSGEVLGSGEVKEVSKVAGEYHYYTLGMQMKDKMVSCPV